MDNNFSVATNEDIDRCVEYLLSLSEQSGSAMEVAEHISGWMMSVIAIDAMAEEALANVEIEINQRLAHHLLNRSGVVDAKYRILDMLLAADPESERLLRYKAKLKKLQKVADRVWQTLSIKARLMQSLVGLTVREFSTPR